MLDNNTWHLSVVHTALVPSTTHDSPHAHLLHGRRFWFLRYMPLQEGIQEWQRLWDRVVVDSRVSWKGRTYSYTDVCTPVSSLDGGCRVRMSHEYLKQQTAKRALPPCSWCSLSHALTIPSTQATLCVFGEALLSQHA